MAVMKICLVTDPLRLTILTCDAPIQSLGQVPSNETAAFALSLSSTKEDRQINTRCRCQSRIKHNSSWRLDPRQATFIDEIQRDTTACMRDLSKHLRIIINQQNLIGVLPRKIRGRLTPPITALTKRKARRSLTEYLPSFQQSWPRQRLR